MPNTNTTFHCQDDSDDTLIYCQVDQGAPLLMTRNDERRGPSVILSDEDRLRLAHLLAPDLVPAPVLVPKEGDHIAYGANTTVCLVLSVGHTRMFLRNLTSGFESAYKLPKDSDTSWFRVEG